ncbi:hypothetical protein M758_3G123900 [Ceratodon purpureus]|uniref:H15 domain-containing protein n=1 Tax=Ceratodon purpureus TaxID=3225 RepID=A0A8T0IK45_CERPU|nr:hypothetical protein KC19_3G122400 [Ceratodon purpureus]KAG0622795.1 hypothetical protein M758_3G123900 [Ceratodon purpureus]
MTYRPKPACMLRNAMLHLKERKGASFAQIRKHLEQRDRNGAKLDPDHKKILTNALRGLVKTGEVSKNGLIYVLKERQNAAEALEETKTKTKPQHTVPHRVPGGKYCKSHSKYHYARKGGSRRRKRRRRKSRRRHHRRRRHRRRKNHKVGHHHRRHCKRHPGRGVHCHRRLRMVFPLRRSSKKRY